MKTGILRQAGKAKEETEKAAELEKIQLAIANAMMTNNQSLTSANLQIELAKEFNNVVLTEKNGLYYTGKYNRYEIEQDGTVTKILGNANKITAQDYGKYVEYTLPEESNSTYTGKWQILYANEGNVYLISEGNIGNATLKINGYTDSSELNNNLKYPAAQKWLTGFKDINGNWYKSNVENIKATLYLLDSVNVWNNDYKNEYADYAIGAPTLELITASYNNINNTDITAIANQAKDTGGIYYGYPAHTIGGLNDLVNETYLYNAGYFNYWLANPSNGASIYMCRINKDIGYIHDTYYLYTDNGFRPVICLKSDVILTWDNSAMENGAYILSRNVI